MDNVTFVDVEYMGEVITNAIIDRGNGEFTSMLKSVYDEQQEALANFVLPTLPVTVEETAPEEEAPVEEPIVEEPPTE